MLGVTIIAIGKLKETWMQKGFEEYEKRLRPFCKFSLVELPEYRLSQNPGEIEIAQGLEKEAQLIFAKIPPKSIQIALCIEGRQFSSEQLGQFLESSSQKASHITLIIGSSFGLANTVKQSADLRISLSAMTFPHQLARIVLMEQIYRAFSITHGSKYHK